MSQSKLVLATAVVVSGYCFTVLAVLPVPEQSARKPASKPKSQEPKPPARKVLVATNRQREESDGDRPTFGTQFGDLGFLECDVVVGDDYEPGDLRAIDIKSMKPVAGFKGPSPGATQTREDKPSVLVFVHGFFVGFEESIQRATQIAHELDYRGTVCVFAWPSVVKLTTAGYKADADAVERSVPAFCATLRHVVNRLGPDAEIQILAHSLGCRLFAKSADSMIQKAGGDAKIPRFANVILAAPDIDAGSFEKTLHKAVLRVSQRTTAYYSDNDDLLGLAKRFGGGGDRVGFSGIGEIQGIEGVDYSQLGGRPATHNLYRAHPVMVKDLRGVLAGTIPRSHRQFLAP